ncbi:MAG: hypothetical protein HYT89_02750 [Candidatus Omnitrophica bacterium]|nr:hypothetical protein [Candidatus Omnitrophota bacterium]
MRKVMMLVCVFLGTAGGVSFAEWAPISNGLGELGIRTLAVDPRDAAVIYAGSERALYRTPDGGRTWKEVLSFKGRSSPVKCLYLDEASAVYVGVGPRVRFSTDGGKRWKTLFKVPGSSDRAVLCLARAGRNSEELWVGTGNGLFVLNTRTGKAGRLEGFPDVAVGSVRDGSPDGHPTIAVTNRGIYTVSTDRVHWQKTLLRHEPEAEESPRLGQFDIEELLPAQEPRLIYSAAGGGFYASIDRGLWAAGPDASAWEKLDGRLLGGHPVNAIADSPRTFYAATDAGVFQWDPRSGTFRRITQGLGSRRAQAIFYSRSGDYLLAGTAKGLFKYPHPEINFGPGEGPERSPTAEALLGRFESEPAVLEVQNAAIRYAECSPEKIEAWRRAASRKAFFPTVSLDTDLNRDQNVDIDRGGTNDPDRFIIGPEEKSLDWSIGLNWDLGDLVWNGDQTSIDTRSKLMVELRNDIVSEVTHLYYERRRLQAEMTLAPPADTALEVEKRLRLEELTSQIDALTGGFLSRHTAGRADGGERGSLWNR